VQVLILSPAGEISSWLAKSRHSIKQQGHHRRKREAQQRNQHGNYVDTAQSASAASSATQELTLYLSNKISSALKIQVNILRGFSNASPDYGFRGTVTGIF
jgi:hypothetical protein